MAGFSKYQTGKGQRWRVVWRDSKGTTKNRRGFLTKREAESWWKSQETLLGKNSGEKLSVSQAWDVRKGEADWKPSTLGAKETWWRNKVDPVWGHRLVTSIARQEVDEWLQELAESGLSKSSINSCLAVLAGALSVAVRRDIIQQNPALGVRQPKIKKEKEKSPLEDQIPTEKQLNAFIKHAEETSIRDKNRGRVIRFLSETGLRWGELSALEWSKIDLIKKRAIIDRNYYVTPHDKGFITPKTGVRRIALSSRAVEVLEETPEDKRTGLVFPNHWGNPRRNPTADWWQDLVKSCRKNGIDIPKVFTPHSLRHYAASNFIRRGIRIPVVAEQLGHSDISMTISTYTHIVDDDLGDISNL